MPEDEILTTSASCKACLDLEFDRFPVNGLEHYPRKGHSVRELIVSIRKIIKAKKRGCQPCYAIVRAIELRQNIPDSLQSRIHEPGSSRATLVLREATQPLEVRINLIYKNPPGDDKEITDSFEIFTDKAKPSPWKAFAPGRQITPILHSKRRQKIIHDWTETCNGSHSICKFPLMANEDLPPPKRLLALGSNPRKIVKLVNSDHVRDYYAAVICKTGPTEACSALTTSQNLRERQVGIRWFELPTAFQEAIVMAMEQKIRYLWIPSLCVVQDDLEDRHWHMDRQDLIFRHSYLTIAFTSAPNCNHSGFGPRRPDGPSLNFNITLSDRGHRYLVHVRDCQHAAHLRFGAAKDLSAPFYYRDEASECPAPLLEDAWAFQQLLLSVRVVHLHGSEMVWECASCQKCECGWLDKARPFKQQRWRQHLQHVAPSSSLSWNEIRKDYSRLQHKDKSESLICFAGLAHRWSETSRKEHFAGLFASTLIDLAKQLLWVAARLPPSPNFFRVPTKDAMTSKYHDPSIPSWSWASMSLGQATIWDPVLDFTPRRQPATFELDPGFQYIDVSCVPLPGGKGDRYLAQAWTLYLKGPLLLGKIFAPPRSRFCTFAPANQDFLPRYPEVHKTHNTGPQHDWFKLPAFEPDCDLWHARHMESPVNPLAYFLKLGCFVSPHGTQDSTSVEVGIVLCRTPARHPSKRNGLERIGTFSVPADIGFFKHTEVQDVRIV